MYDNQYAVVWYSCDHEHGTHLCETRQAAQRFILDQMPEGIEGLFKENELTLGALCGCDLSPFLMVRVLCTRDD